MRKKYVRVEFCNVVGDLIGTRRVKAVTVGLFGIHRNVTRTGGRLDGWKVTHIPTGACIAVNSVRDWWPTREMAIGLARRLRDLGVSWDVKTKEEMPKSAKKRGKAARDRYVREVLSA